jgi:hypothetical protein
VSNTSRPRSEEYSVAACSNRREEGSGRAVVHDDGEQDEEEDEDEEEGEQEEEKEEEEGKEGLRRRKPVRPSTTRSRVPGASRPTTGRPDARASQMTWPNVSVVEG